MLRPILRTPPRFGFRTRAFLILILLAGAAGADETIEPVYRGRLEPCCREPAAATGEKASFAVPRGTDPGAAPDLDPLDAEAGKMGLEPSPPVRERFNGLDRAQAAHQGRDGFPPDTSIAAGEHRVLQAASSALRLSAMNGKEAVVKSLNDFFDVPDAPLLSRPAVYYDRMAKRFYVAALAVDPERRETAIHVAFSSVFVEIDNLDLSRTFQDGGTWCAYRIPADFAVGAPAFASSLSLGQNETWIALGTDHYRYSDGAFRISVLHAIDKLSLSNFVSGPCPTLSFARFNVPRDADGKRAMALQPARHYTHNELPGRPLYLVSSQTLFQESDVYTLWRLEGSDTGSVNLGRVKLRGDFTYTQPPPAPQRGGPDLDAGDTRITHAAFRDGKVWAVHATGCAVGKPPDESCLRLVEITPGETGGEITHEENLGRRDLFLWAPGVAVNYYGDVLVPFQRSRSGQFLGTGYVVRRAAKGSFDAMRNLSGGRCPLVNLDGDGSNLAGRSTGAQTDPRDSFGFWVAGEYPGDLEDLGCDWRTRVGLARDREPAREPPVELASGQFTLPSADSPASPNFELEVELGAAAPAGLGDTAGRSLVVALRDAGRPERTCAHPDHPRNGCAAVDYPLEEPNLQNSNWVALEVGDRRRTFYLTESQDLSSVPDPLKPD